MQAQFLSNFPQSITVSKVLADFWGQSFVENVDCTVVPNSPLETYRWETLLSKNR